MAAQMESWGAGGHQQGGQQTRAALCLSLHPHPTAHPSQGAGTLVTPPSLFGPPRLRGLPQPVQQRVLHGPRVPREVSLRGHRCGLLQPEAGPHPQPPSRIRHRSVSAARGRGVAGGTPFASSTPVTRGQPWQGLLRCPPDSAAQASPGDSLLTGEDGPSFCKYFPNACEPGTVLGPPAFTTNRTDSLSLRSLQYNQRDGE